MRQANVHQTIEKRTRRQDHGSGLEYQTDLSTRPNHTVALQNQIIHGLLEDHQIFLILQDHPHRTPVQGSIRLSARCPDCRSFGTIQDPELNARLVRGPRHGAAKGINFLDQMPFTNPANGRVTGHLTQGVQIMGQ